MVDWINLFDIVLVGVILYFSKVAYEKKYYMKFFEYFKIVIAIYIASKFAPPMGHFLQNIHILKADTYIVLLLISFGINFGLLYIFWKNMVRVLDRFFSTEKIKTIVAKLFSFLEVTIVITLILFIVMQLYISKVYIYKSLKKTYTYPYIEKFYVKFLNNEILAILQGSSTGTNTKEVLFKSFTN